MNASSIEDAIEIYYFITNVELSKVTPEWIVNTYSLQKLDRVFFIKKHSWWLGLREYQVRDKWRQDSHFILVFCAYTFITCHQLTGGLQRRWANKPLKAFTEAMDAFRTAMSFRFFSWLTNNRIGFCLSQREFGLYLGLKVV